LGTYIGLKDEAYKLNVGNQDEEAPEKDAYTTSLKAASYLSFSP